MGKWLWRKEEYLVNGLMPPKNSIEEHMLRPLAALYSAVIPVPVSPQFVEHGLDTMTPLVQLRSSIDGLWFSTTSNLPFDVVDSNTIVIHYDVAPNLLQYLLQVTVVG